MNNNKKVDFRVFVWAIGIIFLVLSIFAGIVMATNGRIDSTNGDIVEMKVMLGEVRSDVGWIKDYFIKNGVDTSSSKR